MYLSLNWLKELVNINRSISPLELAQKLTMHTVEVEKTENQADRFNNVVIGKILEVSKHPNADRLSLVKVDVKKEILNIVCGAPNVAVWQLVPVALVGAILPNGMEIKEAEVRGEKSSGMICAEDELGLGENHAGIMVLSKKAKLGEPFSGYLKYNDVIFEVDNKSLSNRPDLWGYLGIAREIAVFLDLRISKKFKEISEDKIEEKADEKLNIKIEEINLCPRYMAVKISEVEIKESPEWIKERLIASGMRPINNIVDATNYVMLELGQPMHSFDSLLVSDIIVRLAKKDELIKTLDGEERKLDESILVIADKERILAVAGVMGGENSEINQNTNSIILESANFRAESVRKTSDKLSLRTESSTRFEKALDPNMCEAALARCLKIIRETCPKAKVASEVFDAKNFNLNQGPIEIDLNWISKRLGENLGRKKIVNILEKLGFEIEAIGHYILKLKVPTFRATKDISIKEDILEEIARIYGYDNISFSMPEMKMEAPEINKERMFERKTKDVLSLGASLTEVYNYSFVSEEKLKKLKINPSEYLSLKNPISNIYTMLRQNLFFNLLDNIKINQAKNDRIGLFEIGSIFLNASGTINKNSEKRENLPYQEKRLGLIEAGNPSDDVYGVIKGKLEYLLDNFSLPIKYEPSEIAPDWANKKTFAKIKIGEEEIGFISKVEKNILGSLGIKKDVALIETNFEKIFKLFYSQPEKNYEKGGKFPGIERDLAFVISDKVLYNDIKKEIEAFDKLVSKVELFDVYQGENLEKGKKSLAFHVIYKSLERTLTSEEIDGVQAGLVKNLEKKFDAKIRNF